MDILSILGVLLAFGAILIGQAIEDEKDPSGQGQYQFTPIMANTFKKFVGGCQY